MTITYVRSYYGTAYPNQAPPAALVAKAEATVPMLNQDRTHEYAFTEPTFVVGPQIRGAIGWLVTFTPDAR